MTLQEIEMILSTGVVNRKISSVSGNFSGKSQFSESSTSRAVEKTTLIPTVTKEAFLDNLF